MKYFYHLACKFLKVVFGCQDKIILKYNLGLSCEIILVIGGSLELIIP